jgi:hypothetical protein
MHVYCAFSGPVFGHSPRPGFYDAAPRVPVLLSFLGFMGLLEPRFSVGFSIIVRAEHICGVK